MREDCILFAVLVYAWIALSWLVDWMSFRCPKCGSKTCGGC